jgi:hypothetical protein
MINNILCDFRLNAAMQAVLGGYVMLIWKLVPDILGQLVSPAFKVKQPKEKLLDPGRWNL